MRSVSAARAMTRIDGPVHPKRFMALSPSGHAGPLSVSIIDGGMVPATPRKCQVTAISNIETKFQLMSL